MPLIEQPRALGGAQPQESSAELGSPNAAHPPSPRPSPGSKAGALCPPTHPADMRCRAAPSAPGLGTTRSSAKLPPWTLLAGLWRSRRGGSSKLLTALLFFFLNTCSFMKTITLARSKHIQTNLLYNTRGCQRNREKPLLIHSAVPAQPRRRERPSGAPSAMGYPGLASTPAAGAESGFRGYLAVIFIHISAFGGKNKRFLPNQQANLMQKGRAPPCSPWLQHPLPLLPVGQISSPGIVRVMSMGRSHPLP